MEQLPVIRAPESNKFLSRVSGIMASIGSASLAVMMCISVADVIGRKFFLAPIEGTAELVGIFLVIAASMGLGWCMLTKGHVRISIVMERMPKKLQIVVDIISYLIGLAATGIIIWQASIRMYEYFFKTLGGITPILGLPIWPFMLVMVIGFIWLAVILVIHLIASIREVAR